MAGLAVAYLIAGKVGLRFAVVNPSSTPVWPPSGLSLAALLLFGYRVWPGIFVGAFLTNATTAGSLLTSLGIATGNTLEALLGAYLIGRFAGGRGVFDRSQDIFKFIGFAGVASTSVSATIGVTSLALGGYAQWRDYGTIWLTWWLGDATGDLILAPLLVLWSENRGLGVLRERFVEAGALALSVLAVGLAVFFGRLPTLLCVAPLMWPAFRFGLREVATAIAILATIAIWGTLRGFGPFAGAPNASLLLLQLFMATMAAVMLPTAALNEALHRARECAEVSAAARQQSEAQFRGIVNSAKDAIITIDAEQKVTLFNAEAEAVFGYSAGEMIGRTLDRLMPERVREVHRAHVDTFGQTGVSMRSMGGERILTGLRRDGSEFPMEARISQVEIAGQKLYTVILRDVTERKRAEAEREQLVVHRERLRVAGELHDALSQMLFSVALKLDWCRHKLGPRSTTRAKLEEIRRDTGLMMTQIRRLISELSEAEAQDRTVSEKLRALVESFRELSGIPIDFNQRADPEVLGELGQKVLYNAIQEALANVAKHARANHARVTLERDNNEVRFEVSDDGVGAPPGLRASELSQQPGHFGLRQMQHRLEAAGGRISLEAQPGRGFILAGAVPVNNDAEDGQDSERVR